MSVLAEGHMTVRVSMTWRSSGVMSEGDDDDDDDVVLMASSRQPLASEPELNGLNRTSFNPDRQPRASW